MSKLIDTHLDGANELVWTRDDVEVARLSSANVFTFPPGALGGFLPYVDVTSMGAKGDGTSTPGTGTDDTIAIQAAMALGVAYLPPNRDGTKRYYRTTGRLTLGSRSGIAGPGPEFVEIVPSFAVAGTPNRCIDNDWVNGNTDVVLYGFSLQRSVAGNVQHGILLNGLTGYYIDRIRVYGTPQAQSGCLAISGIGPTTRLQSTLGRIGVLDLRDTTNFGLQLSYVSGLDVGCVFGSNAYREVVGIEPQTSCTAEDISIGRVLVIGSSTSGGTATGMVIVTGSSGGTIGEGITFGQLVIDGGATAIASDTSPGLLVRDVLTGLKIDSLNVRRANGSGVKIGAAGATTTGVVIGTATILDCNQGGNASPDSVGMQFRASTDCSWGTAYIKGSAHTASVEETSSAARISHGRLSGGDTKRFNGIAVTSSMNEQRTTSPTYGVTVAPDMGDGNYAIVTVTDAVAFTISSPLSHTAGRVFTIEVFNNSGGAMGTITWGAQYKIAGAFTNPATGKRRTITFVDNGTNCVEISRAAADIS